MNPGTFDQRLAAMHDHEQKLAATLKRTEASRRLAEDHVATLKTIVAEQRARTSVTVTSEPLTYRKGGQHSFFLDVARDRKRPNAEVKARLQRHQREMDTELPKRQQMRARAAAAAWEAAFYSTPEDRQATDRMLAAGKSPFERETRAISRTDGQMGYFGPPVYLLDQYVPYARAPRVFSQQWHVVDLPAGTAEVNVPRLTVGTATGPQTDTAPVASQDIRDSLVSMPVRTVGGNADASLQWLDQGAGSGGFGVDEMLFADLSADLAQNIDGQALLGSNTNGQLLGVWPAGAIAAANGIVVADTTADAWVSRHRPNLPVHVNTAQLLSLARRIRDRSDGWAASTGTLDVVAVALPQVDDSGRPLVLCQCGDLPPGVVGYYQNIPVRLDANIPTTSGGTTLARRSGYITQGQYAAYAGARHSYTPMLLARPDDLFMFTGEVRLQILERGPVRLWAGQVPGVPIPGGHAQQVRGRRGGRQLGQRGRRRRSRDLTSQQSGSLLILSGSGLLMAVRKPADVKPEDLPTASLRACSEPWPRRPRCPARSAPGRRHELPTPQEHRAVHRPDHRPRRRRPNHRRGQATRLDPWASNSSMTRPGLRQVHRAAPRERARHPVRRLRRRRRDQRHLCGDCDGRGWFDEHNPHQQKGDDHHETPG